WTVPHFEKMLYDNALLARACVSGWRATGAAFLRSVAEETLDFLYREMLDPRGGFYSSLDADSGGGEGLFYTWTPQEVGDALQDPAEAAHACRIFHVSEQGDLDGRSVLRLTPAPPGNQDALPEEAVDASRIERLRRTMFDARARRPRPALDDKIVAAWNGLTLIACVDAALAWGRSEDLAAAENLAGFLLRELSPAGALLRSERSGRAGPAAFLEDHAAVGLGLLALYQTDFDERWYAGAVAQAEAILDRFFDGASGFFDTPSEQSSLWMRPRSVQDSPAPSGGAMAVELLQNLYALTADDRYASAAMAALLGMQDTATDHPAAFATWCLDLQTETSPRRQLAVIGDPSADDFRDLLRAVRELDPPGLVLAGGTGEGSAVPLLKERTRIDGRAAAYLCEHFACRLPVTSPDELRAQLLAQKT
ncbi:MAG TPA: hypothetical protein VLD63_06275, partial [Anaerolineales bacterium]|nr:hypothetical protein [Anaerolineales bacterium]